MRAPGSLALLLLLSLGALTACGDTSTGTSADTVDAATDTTTDEDAADTGDAPDAVADDTTMDDTVADAAADTMVDDSGPTDTSADTAAGDTVDAGDTAVGDTVEPPSALAVTRHGARVWGPVIQLSRTDRQLWIGTRGVPVPEAPDTVRAGLYRYDLDSGAVRVFEDELPHDAYYDFGDGPQDGPVPTAAAHADLGRHVVVAFDGLLTLENGAFQAFPITLPGTGEEVIPTHVAIARDGLRPVAWMTTSGGLLRMNEDTWEVETVIATPEEGVEGQWGDLTVDPDTGDCYAAFYPTEPPSRVVRATVTGQVTSFVPGTGDTPEGHVGQLVWSQSDQTAYVAIGGWAADKGGVMRWDGTDAGTVVTEGQLTKAATGEVGPFGAQALALDDEHHVLAVGGQILGNPIGPTKGGGLAWVDLTQPDHIAAVHTADTPLVGIHASSLVIDPVSRRTYAALSGICSETRLRASGLWALSFTDGGRLRLERPLLSGVRAIAAAESGPLRVGLRDDNGGLACDGFPVQNGLMQVQANGSGLWEPVRTLESSPSGILTAPGITALAVAPGGALAIGTWKDTFFYGPPDGGVAQNPTSWHASLYVEDVAVTDSPKGPVLWLASRTTHHNGDPPQLAIAGPDGAARVAIDDKGGFAVATHFVRDSNRDDDVKGLPSSDVRAVLPAPDGTMLLACARESLDSSVYDRVAEPPFVFEDEQYPGGVVRVEAGDTLTVVTTSEQTPDPRALAWDPSGDLLVGDAEVGLVRVSDSGVTAVDLGSVVPTGAIPRAIWAGDNGDLVVTYDRGVYARLADDVVFVDTAGFGWDIAPWGNGVLVGSDEGLLAIAPHGASLPGFGAVPTAGTIPFEEVVVGGGGSVGECLDVNAVCTPGGTPCCEGLSCGGSGFATMCL